MAYRYRSICVGGVADGKFHEQDDPVAVVRKARRLMLPDGTPGEQVLDETRYRYLVLLATPHHELGCWVPEGTPIEKVVERVLRCYSPNAGMIGGGGFGQVPKAPPPPPFIKTKPVH